MTGSDNERRLPNWIDSFIEYSSTIQTPALFRKWAAIGMISAVMERKIWARTKGSNLYPNLYTILVATPGVGKSQVLSIAEGFLRKVGDIKVAPSSLTTASLIDTIVLAERNVLTAGTTKPALIFNSLQTIASELGVFLPAYDPPFMNTLTKLYDGEHYEERRRTGKVNHLVIENPLLSILGGTTPNYLTSFLPEGAWDQGFTSRTIFVYSNEITHRDIWDEIDEQATYEFQRILIDDLKHISQVWGRVEFSGDARVAMSEWDKSGLHPVPDHSKLTHYNSRRLAHCIKLCMVAAMARSSDKFVKLEDFITAKNWLLEAEKAMPEIFNAMGSSLDSRIIDDCWHMVTKLYERQGTAVSEHLIYAFLRDRMPSYNIAKTIEIMVRSRDLKMTVNNGLTAYIPLARSR